jgi:hypothetical protein
MLESSTTPSPANPNSLLKEGVISYSHAKELFDNKELIFNLLSLNQLEFDALPITNFDLSNLIHAPRVREPPAKKIKTEGMSPFLIYRKQP